MYVLCLKTTNLLQQFSNFFSLEAAAWYPTDPYSLYSVHYGTIRLQFSVIFSTRVNIISLQFCATAFHNIRFQSAVFNARPVTSLNSQQPFLPPFVCSFFQTRDESLLLLISTTVVVVTAPPVGAFLADVTSWRFVVLPLVCCRVATVWEGSFALRPPFVFVFSLNMSPSLSDTSLQSGLSASAQ